MFKKIVTKIRELTPKQLMVAGVFTIALAGAVAGGMALKSSASAAQEIRDCDTNSIDYKPHNGGCGALTPAEFIADVKKNDPSDLKAIYADPRIGGLSGEDDYNRFVKEARPGVIKRNGDVVVDGQVVMTDAWTMGRHSNANPGRKTFVVNGVTYYHSHPSISFASHRQELDVMVLFDKDGTVEFTVMESCGNPITTGNKVKSGGACEALKKQQVSGKENTYTFTTDVSKYGLASIAKVEYYIDGKLWRTETNPSKPTPEYTFTKTATVTAKAYLNVPGKKQIVVEGIKCKTEIKVKEYFYVCKALIATARDNTNRKFRFTVNTHQSAEAKVKSADFTLDDKTTTTGVTDKDSNGNIYKDYDFVDNVKHKVSVKVHFELNGQTVTAAQPCVAEVTPEEEPKCPHNPNLPPDSPECKAPECPEKPGSGFPPGDPRCKEETPEELPVTGPGSLLGLFGGASIVGGAVHKLYLRRRGSHE